MLSLAAPPITRAGVSYCAGKASWQLDGFMGLEAMVRIQMSYKLSILFVRFELSLMHCKCDGLQIA